MNRTHITQSHITQSNIDDSRLEALVVEAADRFSAELSAGKNPSIEGYAEQYPAIATVIRKVFPALCLLESGPVTSHQVTSEDAPERLGDYRIVREIGRGGMGVVYEAEQLSLGRTVALKVLPFAAMLDDRQLKRFKNEARAAATLSHPNIVPVHSVGTERGVHYYAMQLVEGQSLAEVIRDLQQLASEKASKNDKVVSQVTSNLTSERFSHVGEVESSLAGSSNITVPTRRVPQAAISTGVETNRSAFYQHVASLGIQAAEALSHAHESGILHRDIKPANLIVDFHGKLWVTDFGLARIDSDAGMTMTGDLVGTIRYMAPEQSLAKRALVDQRADVYSLGVTLYELVTLRPAFTGADRQQLLKNIAFEQPRPPHKFDPAVPRDLETIILKAIEKNPEDRYQAAADLADDLQRLLEHRPILARPPGMIDVARKWSRRHSGAVLATAAMLLVTLILLSTSSVLIMRSNVAARTAQQKEKDQRIAAEKQKLVAEKNLRRARAAVDQFLTHVSENELLNAPSLQPLRSELLASALKYYQEFVAEHKNDESLQADLAAAYFRLGKITSEIGSKDDALQAHFNALAVFERLAEDDDNHAKIQQESAEALLEIATLERALGHHDAARVSLNKAVDVLTDLAEQQHTDKHRELLAKALRSLGNVQGDIGQHAAQHESLTQAIDLQEELVSQTPSNLSLRFELAHAYNSLAGYHHNGVGDYPAALHLAEKAAAIMTDVVANDDSNLAYKAALGRFHANVGAVRFVMGANKDAIESYHAAIDVQNELSMQNPEVTEYRAAQAASLGNLSLALERLGLTEEALASIKQAIELRKEIVEQNPGVPDYRSSLADDLDRLAGVYHDGLTNTFIDEDEAESARLTALSIMEDLAANYPDVVKYKVGLGKMCLKLGHLYELRGRPSDGRALIERAVKTWESIDDQNSKIQNALAFALYNLSTFHRDAGEFESAIDTMTRVVELREKLVDQQANNLRFRHNLARACIGLAGVHQAAGGLDAAVNLYLRGLRMTRAIVQEDPTVRDYQSILFGPIINLSGDAMPPPGGQWNEVEAEFEATLKLVEWLSREHPNVMGRKAFFSGYCAYFARLYRKAGKPEQALPWYQRAVNVESEFVRENPDDGSLLTALIDRTRSLGVLQSELGHHSDAVDTYRSLIQLEASLLQQHPARKVTSEVSRDIFAQLVSELQKSQEAERIEPLFRDAVSTWTRFERECEDKSGCLARLADLHRQFGLWLLGSNRAVEGKAELESGLKAARQAVQLDPHDEKVWGRWVAVALMHYRLRGWQGVSAEAEFGVQLADNDPNWLLCAAPFYLLGGGQTAYQALCERLLDADRSEVERKQQQIDNWTVRLCTLPSDSAGAPNRVLRLAEGCLGPQSGRLPYYFLMAFGRACYRAGDYGRAVESLQNALDAVPADAPQSKLLISLDLALAHHYWGRPEKAREWRERATNMFQDHGEGNLRWHEGMEIEVLRQEIRQIMGPVADDQRGAARP